MARNGWEYWSEAGTGVDGGTDELEWMPWMNVVPGAGTIVQFDAGVDAGAKNDEGIANHAKLEWR